MIRSYTSALALLAASATPGFAETALGDNFTIDGYAEIGIVKYSGSDSEEFYRGDMDLRYAKDGSVLGFSLGIDGYGVASQNWLVLYPAVEFNTSYGTFALGAPRTATDSLLSDAPMSYSTAGAFELGIAGISVAKTAALGLELDHYGAAWRGDFGATSVAVSAHEFSDFIGDARVISAAVTHERETGGMLGTLTFEAGVEYAEEGSNSGTAFRLGAEAVNGRTTVGALYADLSADAGFPYFPVAETHAAMIYGGYDITDRLTVKATLGSVDIGGGSDAFYVIGAEYGFGESGYVNASYADNQDAASQSLFEVSAGWRF